MDSQSFYVDDRNQVLYHYTPWNDSIYNGKSIEITNIIYDNEDKLYELLKLVEYKTLQLKINFIAYRFPSTNLTIKKALTQIGFYFVEHILEVQIRFTPTNNKRWQPYSKVTLERLTKPYHFEQIKAIAKNNFEYGRFMEDPFCQKENAQKRNENWVIDFLEKGYEFMVYLQKDEVVAFLLTKHEKDTNFINFLLGGSKKAYKTTPILVGSGCNYYYKKEMKGMTNFISAANIDILNIYLRLGGKAVKSFYGYHKVYSGK